jgi:2-polyprenyl-6-methoxyphenol hydroxylase-like FAD-dependent oxidoreductase
MHASQDSYVGLCRIEEGRVNACGLFRRGEETESARLNPIEKLRGEPGSPLNQRLAKATFEENSICSVAGLALRPRRAREHGECCIGDAITMIPPVTGNGMSMAFESAELAINPLVRWRREEISWEVASRQVADACDAAFGGRLRWADRLQTCAFQPSLQSTLLWLVGHSPACWRWCFALTR